MGSDSSLGLLFEIAADPSSAINATEDFRDRASAALGEFENTLKSVMTNALGITKEFALGMGVAVGAVMALGAAMFELANKAAEMGSKIYEASEKTGMSAEALSGVNAMAKITGESFEGLTTALSRASVNLGKGIQDPAHGTGKVLAEVMGGAQNLTELGLKPMDDRIQIVLQRIFELNDIGERNRALQALMGRGWMQNIEVLKMLAEEGFKPAIDQAQKLGILFDLEGAQKARAFGIALKNAQGSLEATTQVLGQLFIPILGQAMAEVAGFTQYLNQWLPALEAYVQGDTLVAMKIFEIITLHHKGLTEIYKEEADLITKLVQQQKGLNELQTPDTGEKLSKRLQAIHLELAAVQESATKEMEIKDMENKHNLDEQKKALDVWYATQITAVSKAATEVSQLFGKQSNEYTEMVNKWRALTEEFFLKKAQLREKDAEDQKRIDRELTELNIHAYKTQAEEAKKFWDGQLRLMQEHTRKQAEEIIKAGNARVAAEIAEFNLQLTLSTDANKKMLANHEENLGQYIVKARAANLQWYNDRVAIIKKAMAVDKEIYGEDSAEYQKNVKEKERLDQEAANKEAALLKKLEKLEQDKASAEKQIMQDLSTLAGKNHVAKIAMIIEEAAVQAQRWMADALAEYAIGNFWAGAEFTAAAALALAMGGASIAGASGGGGAGPSPTAATAAASASTTPVAMAPGAATPQGAGGGGSYQIVVMGQQDGAAHIAGLLDQAVKFNGVQLTASKTIGKP